MILTELFILLQSIDPTGMVESTQSIVDTLSLMRWVLGFMAFVIVAMGGFIAKIMFDNNKVQREWIEVMNALKIHLENIWRKVDK